MFECGAMMVSAVVRRGPGCSQKASFVSLVASNSYGQIDVLLLWRYFIIGLAGPAMIGLNYIFI
jgi:hypothetical protein